MIEDITVTPLKAPFSKWIVMDKGVHLMPEQYTPYAKNIRIKNATTTKRKGYVRVADGDWTIDSIYGMVSITTPATWVQNLLVLWDDWKLYKVNFDNGQTITEVASTTFNTESYILKYWKYLFFLNEWYNKWYYFDWTNGTYGALTITDNAYFRFGEVYKHCVYLVWGKEKSNILYRSRAANRDTPENILNFDDYGSDDLYFKSKIMGLAAIREQLFVFTEDTIEILWEWESWGVLTITSVPIAWSNQPVNPRMVVKADDIVFFWTKENQMKSINYMQWVTETVVWDISHRQNLSIRDFIDTLDEDQSTSFWYYNRNEKTVHRHLRQKWEPMPNVVLVYDVSTDSFFIDTNKYFSYVVEHDNKYYASSSFSPLVFEDSEWTTDDWVAIERTRKTALISVGSPDYRKEFRQVNIYGEKNDDVDIMVTVLVDWQTAFNGTIQASWGSISWLASDSIGNDMVAFETEWGGLKPFEYVITRGNMRARGKNIQIVFTGTSTGDFCLSGIEIWYKNLYDNEWSDKAKPNK